jgi:hypothetical protein
MPAILQNCYFGNSGGDGVSLEGGRIFGANNTFDNNDGAGVSLSDGSYANLNGTTATRNEAGLRAEKSSFTLNRPMFTDNQVGVDLHSGARGDIISGYVKDNKEADIRYNDNVLVGLFDSVARSVQNLSGLGDGGLEWVDQQWAASRILDTTNIQHKARKVVKMAQKTIKWSSRLRLAVKFAKTVLVS